MKKILLTIILILTLICIMSQGNTMAALQSDAGTPAKYTVGNWLLKIRQMESLGGTMGLTDTINTTNLKSETPNNIDVHMQKNTEYGAMVILSASSYGNPNKITDGGTTTGNVSGAVMRLNYEWVSAGHENSVLKNALSRYKNIYPKNQYSTKIGDAIVETNGWHGGGSNYWLDGRDNMLLRRAFGGSIFCYTNQSDSSTENCRAVVVQGEGF